MNGSFWKSGLQWQIYRREVIPGFYDPFKAFSILNFDIDVDISSSLRLLMKDWIWYRCQNRIENYIIMLDNNYVFIKKYISKHRAKWRMFLESLHCKKRMSSNLSDKSCTQENVQLHILHGESWLRGIVIKQLNCK